jgi:hypothetical protein
MRGQLTINSNIRNAIVQTLAVDIRDIECLIAYNVLSASCTVVGEPGLNMTPELIAAWYEEAKDADRYLRL